MSREFEVIREVDLPGAPEDVWTAITADNAAWQFPTGVEVPAGETPAEGGLYETWDPPNHLVVRVQSPDGTFNSLEYVIEARKGGTVHMRYVHSGILADGWEDQYDAIGPHTDFYFHTLGQYLEHFNGREATYVGQATSGIDGPESAGGDDAFDTLRAALGIGDGAAVGHTVHADLGGAGWLDGEIDYLTPEFIGVRTDDGLFRFFGRNHYGHVVGMSAHMFGDGIDAAKSEAVLKSWLDSVYR